MSRRQRLHVPRGTYYVVQRGSAHQPIFSTPEDYSVFERLLAAGLRRNGTTVHAYCWTPQAIHLLLQIDEISVGRFMQGLTSRYARSIHQRAGESGHFFQQRYQATLLDAETYLLKLMNYIHYIPESSGMIEDARAYPHSSHRAYLREADVPWLTTRKVLHSFPEEDADAAYQELMSHAPSSQDTLLFERGGVNDLRVIGSPEFLQNLPRESRTYHSKVSLDQIIYSVTCALGVEREHVLSASRKRELALARALIAWFAMERRVCTLSEVARRLRRDPSTLSVAVSRYRSSRPDLFKLNSLHYLVPLGPQEVRAE
jgi:REP element-mobilizing transposase RayT